MVSEYPVESFDDGAFTIAISSGREVPLSTCSSNHKGSSSDNESIHPKITEQ